MKKRTFAEIKFLMIWRLYLCYVVVCLSFLAVFTFVIPNSDNVFVLGIITSYLLLTSFFAEIKIEIYLPKNIIPYYSFANILKSSVINFKQKFCFMLRRFIGIKHLIGILHCYGLLVSYNTLNLEFNFIR